MANRMSRIIVWVFVTGLTCAPVLAEGEPAIDARLIGYPQPLILPAASTALMWLVLMGLCVICVGPMFLNAKRTHLD